MKLNLGHYGLIIGLCELDLYMSSIYFMENLLLTHPT